MLSHQHVLDSLSDHAQSLPQTTTGATPLQKATEHYQELCENAKDLLDTLQHNVSDHQSYQDSLQQSQDTLLTVKEKVSAFSGNMGDKFTIQSKLDRVKDVIQQIDDYDDQLRMTSELCDKTMPNTSIPGREVLKRSISSLESDWNTVMSEAEESKAGLEQALIQWQEFEAAQSALTLWISRTEQELKDVSLKATLDEKQEQVDKFKVFLIILITWSFIILIL